MTAFFLQQARTIADQCWHDPATKHLKKRPEMTEAVARRLAGWMAEASSAHNSANQFRATCTEIADIIGEVAFVTDPEDGQQVPNYQMLAPIVAELAAGVRPLGRVLKSVPNVEGETIAERIQAIQSSMTRFNRTIDAADAEEDGLVALNDCDDAATNLAGHVIGLILALERERAMVIQAREEVAVLCTTDPE